MAKTKDARRDKIAPDTLQPQLLGTHQVFWARTRCSGGVLGTEPGVLNTVAAQGMHGARSSGTETPGVLAVFWAQAGCAGGVLDTAPGVLEVFWRRARCSGGVL